MTSGTPPGSSTLVDTGSDTTRSDRVHLFPKLPTELRSKIYKHAIPTSRFLRVQCPNYYVVSSDFRITHLSFEAPEATPTDIALPSAYLESWVLYMEINKASLSELTNNSIIRYIPQDTTIFWQSFGRDVLRNKEFIEGLREGYRRQKWIGEINNMGAPGFYLGEPYVPLLWGLGGRGKRLRIFENVEEWTGFVDMAPIIRAWREEGMTNRRRNGRICEGLPSRGSSRRRQT